MQLDPDVLDVLRTARTNGTALQLPGALDRKLYQRVDLALNAVGGKWNRYQRAHIFSIEAADAIAGLLATGEVTTDAERGYYPTPTPIVEQLLDLAELTVGCTLLEPSAGRGAIAEPAAARGAIVDCIELDATRAEHIRAGGYARSVTNADFLSVPVKRKYQRVILNPPFSNRQDIRHVERAMRFVEPGGLVVAVMSGGLSFRTDRLTRDFQARVREARGTITELPDDAFPAVGVRTVVAVIPIRETAPRVAMDLSRPRPEHFAARPKGTQQNLFVVDEPTEHKTAALDGFGYGAPASGPPDEQNYR
ncbi:class I SAM-dependent methyltransferase [Streptomyces melanogenes]|uniref:class I SAM-dependent methyltransferase n=1 Tax=Streptomyces melanogenes TaxID=67326 RepID=UPI0037B111F6